LAYWLAAEPVGAAEAEGCVSTAIPQTIEVNPLKKWVPTVFVGDTVVLTNGTTWEVVDITQGQIRLRDENGKTRNLNGALGGSYSGGNQLRIERIVRHSENAEQSPVLTALATVKEPTLTGALAICETPAPATGTSKLSLPVAPSLLAAIQNRHNLSNEELSGCIEYALVLTLREIFPLVEEMQRRFKILGPRQSDTICGYRSFQEYCNKVLHRTEQGVYKMLREAKFFTQLKLGDEVVVRAGKTKEIRKVCETSGDKIATQSTTKKGPQILIFEKYTGKEVNGSKQRILCAATPEVKAAVEKQAAAASIPVTPVKVLVEKILVFVYAAIKHLNAVDQTLVCETLVEKLSMSYGPESPAGKAGAA
jgi:hypothetical protein